MKLTKTEFEYMLDHLMEIELLSVSDIMKAAKKEGKEDESHMIIAHGYLKGLRRAREIINIVLKDME